MLTFIALLVGVITLYIYWMLRKFKYWERKNVPAGRVIPFFGDNYDIFMGKLTTSDFLMQMYNKVPENYRYVGVYLFHVPALLLRTPEMIKQICVKDYEHFVDHSSIIIESADDLYQKAIFPLKGQEWKNRRSLISPLLNGGRVKLMFPLIGRQVKNFIEFIKEKNQEIVEVEWKDTVLRILTDISYDLFLGIEIDSFRDPDNTIFKVSSTTCDLNLPYKKFYMLLFNLFPSISKFVGLSLFSEGRDFFKNIVKDTIKMREEKGIKRDDLLGLMLEVRKEQLKAKAEGGEAAKDISVITDEEMASYVFIMYFGIVDSLPTVIGFLSWEITEAPEIQERLRNEVDSLTPGDGDPSFQDFANMKYMEMVINETMRKWPPVLATDRLVTKPYTIKPELPHEKPVHLDVGDSILLPVYPIHRNPKFYENPELFDPERFSPENKSKIDPNTFLTFGTGPRFCIGTRLSMLVMKIIVYHLIKNFEIVAVEKTPNPLVMDKEAMTLYPVGGFVQGLKLRN